MKLEDYRTYDSIQMSNILIEKLKIIKKSRPDHTIIFFFDSIDQLNKCDYSLEWYYEEKMTNQFKYFISCNCIYI